VAEGWQKNCITTLSVLLTKDDKITEDEKGEACEACGEDGKCVHNFGWKARREDTTRKT
jgi:hypothetical protein